MPTAQKTEETCPRCSDDSDVWVFEKDEPTITKEHYTCDSCGYEWTEVRQD
jgi:transposase-like protein